MTRSTASPSCWSICSSDSSAMSRSPRRLSAKRSREWAMAVSPPLTATYISDLHGDAARQGAELGAGGEDDVDTAGKQAVVGGPVLPEIVGQAGDGDGRSAVDARAMALPLRPAREAGHFDDQRGGAVGVGVGPEIEVVEWRRRRCREDGEGRLVALCDDRGASVQAQEDADIRPLERLC